jgi:hypothetical protein
VRRGLVGALARAWLPITLVLVVHAGAIVVGAVMVRAGNAFALRTRDALVSRAHREDPASLALAGDHRLEAAAWDFGRNLGLAVIPATVGGLAIVIPYGTAAWRGWVGGIVSVDRQRVSRLADPHERTYYLITLLLQVVPYSLAAGAGVALGFAYLRRRERPGPTWLGLPADAVRDVVWIYVLVVPLCAVASLWEFLAR